MDPQSSDGTQSLRSLSDVHDVLVQCHRPFKDQLSAQRIYERIEFESAEKGGKPLIFHNAWNLDKQKLALFSNRPMNEVEVVSRRPSMITLYVHVRRFPSSRKP